MDDAEALGMFREHRILIYRYILSEIEARAKAPLAATVAIIYGKGFLCSPPVALAIHKFYAKQVQVTGERLEEKNRILEKNSFIEAWFKGFVHDLESIKVLNVELTQRTGVIAQAMCEELGVDIKTLKGATPQDAKVADERPLADSV